MTAYPAHSPDVVVVGDGLVGLASALSLAEAGLSVTVVGAIRTGQASHAAAGMLAPSVEHGGGAAGEAHDFAVRSRDLYPHYVKRLEEASGCLVALNTDGVLQVALDDAQAESLKARIPAGSRWLTANDVGELEPALRHVVGAVFHPRDGSVDNRALLFALGTAAARHPRIARVVGDATAIRWQQQLPGIEVADGSTVFGERLLLAAGAWTPRLTGLPRPLPIEPVRGQMLSLDTSPLGHVVYGPGGYLVPRGGRTLAGSTMEYVAFDAGVTEAGLTGVRSAGDRICPALSGAAVHERWAGLRPVTPDGLPILGVDPERPAIIYACGHSRNGVLLTPLTASCVTALVLDQLAPADLAPFSVTRFGAGAGTA